MSTVTPDDQQVERAPGERPDDAERNRHDEQQKKQQVVSLPVSAAGRPLSAVHVDGASLGSSRQRCSSCVTRGGRPGGSHHLFVSVTVPPVGVDVR